MKNSAGRPIRKHAAGGILSIAVVFGATLGSAGVGFAAPAGGHGPVAPSAQPR